MTLSALGAVYSQKPMELSIRSLMPWCYYGHESILMSSDS